MTTIETRDENRRRLIRATRLQLVIRAFLRLAFTTCECIRRRLDIFRKFIRIAADLLLNKRRPLNGVHLLVRHKDQRLWRQFAAEELVQQLRPLQIDIDGA